MGKRAQHGSKEAGLQDRLNRLAVTVTLQRQCPLTGIGAQGH
mgnify:CR=1 FL=1